MQHPRSVQIVVTGATGFVGRALCLRLRRDGHQLTALVRDAARAKGQLGAEVCAVALDDEAAVRAAVVGADAVVNLAGEPILDRRWTEARKQALRDSRLGITRRLAALLAQRAAPLTVLVSASAVGLYGDAGDRELGEDAPPGDDFAARLCRDWEEAAEAARPHARRVVRARLGIVLGGEGGALFAMLPLFRAGLGGRVGSGEQWVPWIHLEDAADALAWAVGSPQADGAYNVVAPHPVRNRELAAALGRAVRRPAVVPAPALAVRAALGQRAQMVLGSQRALPRRLLAAGLAFRYPTLPEALDESLGRDAPVALAAADGSELPRRSPYLAARRPRYALRTSAVIDRPLEEVFAFFSAAANLAAITPPRMGFAIAQQSGPLAEGCTIDYRIRALGLPMSWRTVIDAWQPPTPVAAEALFVDSQTKGPYASWWHQHRFTRDGDRTRMEDLVLYAPPLGLLGRIANRLLIAGELRRIFAYRDRAMRLRFGPAPGAPANAGAAV